MPAASRQPSADTGCRMPDYRFPMNVIVYTRAGCPLCETGVALAHRVFGVDNVTLVDVDLDLDLLERYNERVPVITSADGTVIDEGIISATALERFAQP